MLRGISSEERVVALWLSDSGEAVERHLWKSAAGSSPNMGIIDSLAYGETPST